VELRDGTLDDEWLTVAMETDARVMAELGGAWSVEQAQAAHRRRIAGAEKGENWWFVIVPQPGMPPVGSIGLWTSEHDNQAISETGWMVLPEHQGKGHASAALKLLLAKAAADGRWGDIHAFPGATNAPSNALCRKFGFEQVGSLTVDYAGRSLRVNHWVFRATTAS
jgi:RimJ/RimL family protein N-acetyltransferase